LRPELKLALASQECDGFTLCHWEEHSVPNVEVDIVIEAFGCRLPTTTISAMAAMQTPPVWINLEYLSAEKWVEQSKIFLRRVSQESKQEKVSSLAGEQTKFDADILTVARALQGQIIGHLNEAKQSKTLLPPKDISLLSGSLSTIQRIGRTALDLDSWTPDKIVNEALKLGYLLTDPRTLTSDTGSDGKSLGKGRDSDSTETNPFSDILATTEDTATSVTANDSQ
jgi:hypothetical protein